MSSPRRRLTRSRPSATAFRTRPSPTLAQGCEAGRVEEKPGRIEIEVNYLFPETPNADWTDRLKLVAEGDGLRIDDIVFADVANGEPDQRLRRALFEAFDH